MVFLGEVFNQGETDEGGQRRIHQSVRHSCPNGVASDEEIESSEGEEQYRKRKNGNDVVPASKTVAIAETAIVTLGNEGFLFAGRMMCVVMPPLVLVGRRSGANVGGCSLFGHAHVRW